MKTKKKTITKLERMKTSLKAAIRTVSDCTTRIRENRFGESTSLVENFVKS